MNKMFDRPRYFDTAAISFDCAAAGAYGLPNFALHEENLIPIGYEVFYGPNATQCLLNFFHCLNGLVPCSLERVNEIHPVIEHQVSNFSPNHKGTKGLTIGIGTRYSWLDGVEHELQQPASKCDIFIEDIVQGVGTIRMKALLNNLKPRRSTVYLGCLQKWAGSAFPVGFMLIPETILIRFPELITRLSALDYLGNSVPRGSYINRFEDTFSSTVGRYIATSLSLAFGVKNEDFERRSLLIESNAEITLNYLKSYFTGVIVDSPNPSSGIVTVTGDLASVTRQYNKLALNATIYKRNNEATIRFSAPLVDPVDIEFALEK